MKTYRGKLKDGMPYTDLHGTLYIYKESIGLSFNESLIKAVHWDNEWQHYKPTVKKVWGIPEAGGTCYLVALGNYGYGYVAHRNRSPEIDKPTWLCEDTAEQIVKAETMRDEFRLLSDVPVDGVEQWYVCSVGAIYRTNSLLEKLHFAIFGVVFNTREQAEKALAKFPQIHIANKILQFGFHGIVEERL